MKWISYIFSLLWRFWFFIVFIITFLLFLPLLFIFTAIHKNSKFVSYITRYWSKLTLYCSFIFPKIEWEEKIDSNDVFIFCPNHTSTLDIPFLFAILPLPIQFMGKAELTKIPLFGYFFKENSVIVNRKNLKNSYEAFQESAEKLNNGLSMCIFPEGGIPSEKTFLKKFKNGPFRLAIEQKISIVPVTIPDNKNIFPKEYFKGKPGIVRIKVHKEIKDHKVHKRTLNNLNTSVYNIIFEQLKNYEKEH